MESRMKTSTLKGCLEEMKRRGYTRFLGIWYGRTIDEFIEEMEENNDFTGDEYTIFGDWIVRVSDAWEEDAEVYILDC